MKSVKSAIVKYESKKIAVDRSIKGSTQQKEFGIGEEQSGDGANSNYGGTPAEN